MTTKIINKTDEIIVTELTDFATGTYLILLKGANPILNKLFVKN